MFFDIFNMIDFLHIFITSQSTKILIESKFWLGVKCKFIKLLLSHFRDQQIRISSSTPAVRRMHLSQTGRYGRINS